MSYRSELGPMLRLAIPLVLAELGWMSMGIVDTIMVGRLPNSAEAIGAVSLGGVIFYTVGMFGGGLLLGLDTLVSQAFGAGDLDDCHHSLLSSIYFLIPLAPVLMALVWLATPLLASLGIHPAVLKQTISYLGAINWSTPPLLLYFALRRYLQGINVVRPVTLTLVSANLVNLAGNWALIYGRLGAPALGVAGSGWATCISRLYMALVLLGYILWREGGTLARLPLDPDFARIRRLVGLGLPAAMQITLEIGVFAIATALIGRLDPDSLAGHQVAMNTVTFTFMVPLGISSAAAVRVGQALGRDDRAGASRAGWTALALGAGFMLCSAIALWLVPRYIARIFTPDGNVIRSSVRLLFVAAFFQLFDALQVIATGALRGTGDTRTPMALHLLGYWAVGLPLGYYLCFGLGLGAPGLWIGLCIALILIGSLLLAAWSRQNALKHQ